MMMSHLLLLPLQALCRQRAHEWLLWMDVDTLVMEIALGVPAVLAAAVGFRARVARLARVAACRVVGRGDFDYEEPAMWASAAKSSF